MRTDLNARAAATVARRARLAARVHQPDPGGMAAVRICSESA